MDIKNIFSEVSIKNNELFENIINSKNCKIERIISNNNSVHKELYEQDKNEFVLVLKGSAELLFYPKEKIKMKEGDYIIIPAHLKHKVEKTTNPTIWLTVFY